MPTIYLAREMVGIFYNKPMKRNIKYATIGINKILK